MARTADTLETARHLAIALVVGVLIAALGIRPRATFVDRLLERGSAAAAAGQPAAAQASLEEAMAFDPALASLHLTAARLAFQAGDLEAARQHLKAVPTAMRASPQFACLSGQVESGASPPPDCGRATPPRTVEQPAIPPLDSLGPAAVALQAELDRDPQDLPGWERLAALTLLTNPPSLEPVLQQAYRYFPKGSRILDGLWQVTHSANPPPAAAEAVARAGQLLAAQGDWALAGAAWARALELDPNFPEAKAFLGLAASRTGGEARPLLVQAAREAPDDPIVRSLLGQYWLSIGDAEAAVPELTAAQSLAPDNPAITASLGSALAQSGRIAEAAEAFRQAAAVNPRDASFWLLLADFCLRYDYQVDTLGISAARNAISLAPGNVQALSAMGMAAHLSGDHLTAERMFSQALNDDPSNALAWYRYAIVLLDLGRDAEARRALDTAVKLDPGGDVGQLADRSLENLLTGFR